MAGDPKGILHGRVRMLFEAGTVVGLTDGQLLERFATRRDSGAELAFAALVERHGPMVLRACRGVLGDEHEAMDAFQATFLVLARKGGSLWVRDSLGPWLHRVACRAAGRAKKAAARRRASEQKAVEMAETRKTGPDADRHELAAIVHEEVDRLPERYRAAVVLCDLEGRTCEDAARHLGCPVGTVGSRLARGRDRLRERLTRRGLASGLLAWQGPREPLPPGLVGATVAAATRFLSIQAASQGAAAFLALGVIRTMTMTSFWKAATILLALGASTSGVVTIASRGAGSGEVKPDDLPKADAEIQVLEIPVQSGPLRIVVDERGSLEAAQNSKVFSQVEGQTKILTILPEGTRVEKGQLVCELDSASLRDQLTNQRVTQQQAEAGFESARLAREVAEIAMKEYIDGVYPSELATVVGNARLAESALKRAEERLQRTKAARERLNEIFSVTTNSTSRPGPASADDVVAQLDIDDRLADAEQAVAREQLSLEVKQSQGKILETTREKTIKQLEIEITKARANESARESTLKLEQDKAGKLERQILRCKLVAPDDGVVVYANALRGIGGRVYEIKEGVSVRERQLLFTISDLSVMRVVSKVPESWVDQVASGQKTQVWVDAFPDRTFSGVVESVSPLPDPPISPANRGIKVYTTNIAITDGIPELRPGMTARIEILVKELNGVLSVPLASVVRYDDQDRVAVRSADGKIDWRAVVLGTSNGRLVEVKNGLKPGEAVALDPQSLLTDDQKRQAAARGPTRPARPKAQ